MNTSLNISNRQFLQTIFGDYWPYAICTVFQEDPADTSKPWLWSGQWAGNISNLEDEDANTFYTVSLFAPDSKGSPARRKELFSATHVIVIDDIGTKISGEKSLPDPTYRLETSRENEQWGYVLETPCIDQKKVDALQDAIVYRLADGTDPGQKGTTRYVRLPVGTNKKGKYEIAGAYPSHRLLEWHPDRRFDIDRLMDFFGANLPTTSASISELNDVDPSTHPFLKHLNIKARKGEGRYDITCPWLDEHTDQLDNGTAVMVRPDQSVGFECHHGHCNARTGNDLVRWLQMHGKVSEEEAALQFAPQRQHKLNFIETPSQDSGNVGTISMHQGQTGNIVPGPWEGTSQNLTDEQVFQQLRSEILTLLPGENYREVLHKAVILDAGYQEDLVATIADHLGTNRGAVRQVMREMVRHARPVLGQGDEVARVLDDYVYLAAQGKYVHKPSGEGMRIEALLTLYSHLGEPFRDALQTRNGLLKVHNLGFAPGEEEVYTQQKATYFNLWRGLTTIGRPGPIDPWWQHLCVMLPDERERNHVIGYMAYTLQHPGEKINHGLLWGSMPGSGKDTILWPLTMALGQHAKSVNADAMTQDFHEFFSIAKLVIFQEADLGSGPDGKLVHTRMKTVLAAPPDEMRVNRKGVEAYWIKNVLSCIVTTNEHNPIPIYRGDRRWFMVWTHLQVTDGVGNVTEEWANWFDYLWGWMKFQGGAEHVINWLLNIDVSWFKPKKAPAMTMYREDVIERHEHPGAMVIRDLLSNGLLESGVEISSNEIYNKIRGLVNDWSVYGLREIPSKKMIGDACREFGAVKKITGKHRTAHWIFP